MIRTTFEYFVLSFRISPKIYAMDLSYFEKKKHMIVLF